MQKSKILPLNMTLHSEPGKSSKSSTYAQLQEGRGQEKGIAKMAPSDNLSVLNFKLLINFMAYALWRIYLTV